MANRKSLPARVAPDDAGNVDPELGRVLARTLQLLSNAATIGVCKGRMRNLVRHLAVLAEHPQAGRDLRATSEALLREWRSAQQEHFGVDDGSGVTRH